MVALTFYEIKQVGEIVREEIKKETSLLPTKDEFFTWMDRIYTKLTSMEKEMTVMNNRITRNEIEIEKLKS